MNNVVRKITFMFINILVVTVVIASVFFGNELKSARQVTGENIDQLTGQRIGALTAWEADYILSGRDDITLKRYDEAGDMLMALCYKQIDAAALGSSLASYIMQKVTGLKVLDEPIDHDKYCAVQYVENKELNQQFDAWAESFYGSARSDEIREKIYNNYYSDGCGKIEETGTGEVIKVGYNIDGQPCTFIDTISGGPRGFEVDIMTMFANDNNYQIEWVEATETTVYPFIEQKKIQLYVGGYAEVYRGEFDVNPDFELSKPYLEYDIVVLVVDDWNNLSLNNYQEEEE